MLKSIKHFAKLCVFRGNPADVEGNTLTLVILFFILLALDPGIFLVSSWMTSIKSSPTYHVVVDHQVIVDAVVQVLSQICVQLFVALCIYVILYVRKVPQYFRQTFSAYLGVNIIIALLPLVVFIASMLVSSHQELNEIYDWRESYLRFVGPLLIVVLFVFVVSAIWKVLALAYILFKIMEVKFWQAGVVAIMLIYATEGIVRFFPIFNGLSSS